MVVCSKSSGTVCGCSNWCFRTGRETLLMAFPEHSTQRKLVCVHSYRHTPARSPSHSAPNADLPAAMAPAVSNGARAGLASLTLAACRVLRACFSETACRLLVFKPQHTQTTSESGKNLLNSFYCIRKFSVIK